METYIGTKVINARPMNRRDYNEFRGWELPADENGDDEGYLVEYTDGGQANTDVYEGYVSWSPSAVFEKSYRDISGGMTFGDAIHFLKEGKRVARKGWNGKGMWIAISTSAITFVDASESLTFEPYIIMYTAQGTMQPGWLASQADMLAEDWVIPL